MSDERHLAATMAEVISSCGSRPPSGRKLMCTDGPTTRWARTGTHVFSKEWLDDNLAGILWYVGLFVVLGMAVDVVRAMEVGGVSDVDFESIAAVALPATVVAILLTQLFPRRDASARPELSVRHKGRSGAKARPPGVITEQTRR